jgi:sulfur relay (sulfurtransferase) DsrC/TusE family protein
MKVGHKEIATDAEGFLRHLDDGDKTIANKVAEN